MLGAVSWLCAWWRQGAGAGCWCWVCFSFSTVNRVPLGALELLPMQGAIQKNILHVFAIWGLCWYNLFQTGPGVFGFTTACCTVAELAEALFKKSQPTVRSQLAYSGLPECRSLPEPPPPVVESVAFCHEGPPLCPRLVTKPFFLPVVLLAMGMLSSHCCCHGTLSSTFQSRSDSLCPSFPIPL